MSIDDSNIRAKPLQRPSVPIVQDIPHKAHRRSIKETGSNIVQGLDVAIHKGSAIAVSPKFIPILKAPGTLRGPEMKKPFEPIPKTGSMIVPPVSKLDVNTTPTTVATKSPPPVPFRPPKVKKLTTESAATFLQSMWRGHHVRKLYKNDILRTKVIKEILKTEAAYLLSLNKLIEHLYKPLKRAIQIGKPVIADDDFKQIFSNIEAIITYNTKFHEKIRS